MRNGKLYYYLQDGLGHVRVLVDTAGAVAATYAYTPYGTAEAGTETVENPLRFKGREWDAAAGLYFLRARYYDPQLGRFLAPDPLGVAGGVNLYAFAGGDPVNAADPTGLQCIAGRGQCINTVTTTAAAPTPRTAPVNPLAFASGIYWFVSQRYGANDGSVAGPGGQQLTDDAPLSPILHPVPAVTDASRVASAAQSAAAIRRNACLAQNVREGASSLGSVASLLAASRALSAGRAARAASIGGLVGGIALGSVGGPAFAPAGVYAGRMVGLTVSVTADMFTTRSLVDEFLPVTRASMLGAAMGAAVSFDLCR